MITPEKAFAKILKNLNAMLEDETNEYAFDINMLNAAISDVVEGRKVKMVLGDDEDETITAFVEDVQDVCDCVEEPCEHKPAEAEPVDPWNDGTATLNSVIDGVPHRSKDGINWIPNPVPPVEDEADEA